MTPRRPNCLGFTLIELLAASAITGALLTALYTVFFTTLEVREQSLDQLGREASLDAALRLIRRDFEAMQAPDGLLAGAILGERGEGAGGRADSIEFYAASGRVDGESVWGPVQRVTYSLAEMEDGAGNASVDLVRSVTRNLLPSIEEDPVPETVLAGVATFELSYYDGTAWSDSWDSSALSGAAPEAVRFRAELAQNAGAPEDRLAELVVEVADYNLAASGEAL